MDPIKLSRMGGAYCHAYYEAKTAGDLDVEADKAAALAAAAAGIAWEAANHRSTPLPVSASREAPLRRSAPPA